MDNPLNSYLSTGMHYTDVNEILLLKVIFQVERRAVSWN